jgi:hypothetical protein
MNRLGEGHELKEMDCAGILLYIIRGHGFQEALPDIILSRFVSLPLDAPAVSFGQLRKADVL